MNELMKVNGVLLEVKPGTIEFPRFEELKEQATEVLERLKTVEVTDDNITESKKLVARVRKVATALDTERKNAKKELLKTYTEAELHVKEIISIIDEGDKLVREQVRAFEVKQKEEKYEAIKQLWVLHTSNLDCLEFLDFNNFFEESMLNKSTSKNKIETLLVDHIEIVKSDLLIISSLPNKERVLKFYNGAGTVATAIQLATEDERREQEAKLYQEKLKEVQEKSTVEQISEVVEKAQNECDGLATILIPISQLELVKTLFAREQVKYRLA